MRENLKKIDGVRKKFTGVFVREGEKPGWSYSGPRKTVLLRDITDEKGQIVTDHLWFNLTKGFENECLVEGDIVEFHARVKPYLKGYSETHFENPFRLDYKLSHPTKIRCVGWVDDDGNYVIAD